MTFPIPPALRAAYSESLALARAHYENFPVASLLLPKESRFPIAALYAFARTADDFADEPRYEGRRLKEIDAWQGGFKAALQGRPAPPILKAFAHTVRHFRIPPSLPLDLLEAYRMDLKVHRYPSWERLLFYCRHSAEPVGRIVLFISGIRDGRLHRYSDFICSGLQLINFWQDSALDLEKGRIYYPRTELKRAGLSSRDLLGREDSPAFRRMVRAAVDHTEAHFRRGLPLVGFLRGRLKLEIKATYLGGLGILNKIRRMDYNVLGRRPSFTGAEKASLALKALFGRVNP